MFGMFISSYPAAFSASNEQTMETKEMQESKKKKNMVELSFCANIAMQPNTLQDANEFSICL